jgi:hypothetical protein
LSLPYFCGAPTGFRKSGTGAQHVQVIFAGTRGRDGDRLGVGLASEKMRGVRKMVSPLIPLVVGVWACTAIIWSAFGYPSLLMPFAVWFTVAAVYWELRGAAGAMTWKEFRRRIRWHWHVLWLDIDDPKFRHHRENNGAPPDWWK